MTNEKWAHIPNTSGRYSISTLGRICSHDVTITRINQGHEQNIRFKGRMLKPTLGKNGYYYVSLVRNNEKKKYYVHRLVLETFIGSKPDMEANHKNGICTDNRLLNLEWVTGKGNMQHCVYTLGHLGRLTAPMRRVKCLETGKVYPSISAAARSQGVTPRKIWSASEHGKQVNGYHWKVIDAPGKPSELIEQMKKPVMCVETGVVYGSLTEAAEDVERCVSAISLAISGKSHVCAGCHWRFA